MKIKFLKEWARTFVFIFGILQMLLAVSACFLAGPRFSLSNFITLFEVVVMLFASAIFTTSYFVITSDPVTSRRAMILRIVGCSIPCTLMASYLATTFGFHELLLELVDALYLPFIFTQTERILWYIFYFASIVIYVGIFLVIAIKHQKQGKLYNAALDEYKKNQHKNTL